MTFVFEARELPFADVSEAYAQHIDTLVRAHDLHHLPLWDRCMLAAVLPVVLQRRQAVADAVAASLSITTSGPATHSITAGSALSAPAEEDASEHDGGDVADASRIHAENAAQTSAAVTAGVADIETALAIVHQLDELEVVYDSIVSTRAAQRAAAAAEKSGNNAASPHATQRQTRQQPKKTSEEIIMEQLMQERFSDTAPYLPESSEDDDTNGEGQGEEFVDVAMCFTTKGDSLGIGSSAVFGGHGYHAE